MVLEEKQGRSKESGIQQRIRGEVLRHSIWESGRVSGGKITTYVLVDKITYQTLTDLKHS